MNNLEILAPAGSFDSVRAAVCAGADAVYLGAKKFSARQNADNFDETSLADTVRYCHQYGVLVYLAVNTTVFDDELSDVAKTIAQAADLGVDALIIQDMGVYAVARKVCPDMRLHASTQMSVQSAEGVKQLETLGFKRVVLARELSLSEICEIAEKTSCELEVFVHGALCMCVSGQCYLSSMIGRRSGNRGLCAQPCRLPFKSGKDTEYSLSLKDLSLIKKIDELKRAGVFSLKIEGRMKRPEYVAASVAAARKAADGTAVSEDELLRLKSVFSRSGFTDGYLTGKRTDMFGTRQKDDVTAAAGFLKEIEKIYAKDVSRRPVAIDAIIKSGEPIKLIARSGNFSSEVSGFVPETALNKETTAEMVKQSLSKTGGTPFFPEQINVNIDGGLALPVSKLNAARRELLDDLLQKVSATKPIKTYTYNKVSGDSTSPCEPTLFGRFSNAAQIPQNESELSKIILPIKEIAQNKKLIDIYGGRLCAELPRAMFSAETGLSESLLSLKKAGLSSALCTNLSHINLCKAAEIEMSGGFSLNIANSEAIAQYENLGLSEITLSPEIAITSAKRLVHKNPLGILGYGYMPLMLMRNCPVKNSIGCEKCNANGSYLKDRTNTLFYVKCDGSRSSAELFNSKPLYLADRINEFSGLSFLTLYFTREDSGECQKVISDYKNQSEKQGEITRGLYYRGVL